MQRHGSTSSQAVAHPEMTGRNAKPACGQIGRHVAAQVLEKKPVSKPRSLHKGLLSLTMLAWLWYLLELLPTLPKPRLRRKVSQ